MPPYMRGGGVGLYIVPRRISIVFPALAHNGVSVGAGNIMMGRGRRVSGFPKRDCGKGKITPQSLGMPVWGENLGKTGRGLSRHRTQGGGA